MITLQQMTRSIVSSPMWDRKRLAKRVGVDYVTVCRWTAGLVTTTTHQNMEKLTAIWLDLCRDEEQDLETGEGEYHVGQGETQDVDAGSVGQITIINYGVVRIIRREDEKEGKEPDD